ncbi:hypothetical protein D915_005845 [Fasciola hepatica]|uniref:Uncharacterized protein n=1 Tax=Fasciola hepatica TaxID=6192 RepID=A0A4E0RRB5_FASHE|nr:hypothetical protein D915_005845 [Fasciola hepatica]
MDPVRVIDQRKPRPHRKSKKVKRGAHKPVSDPKVSEEPQKEVNKITIKVPKEQFISNKDGNTHASEDTNKVNHQHHRKIQPRPKFVSKYADLTNHGIPCFVEKRLLERACQKLRVVWSRTNFASSKHVRIYRKTVEYVRQKLEAQLRMEENGADELDRQFLQHLRHIQTETYHYEQFLEQQQTSDRDEPTIEIGRSGTISTMKSRMNTTSNHRFPPLSSYNHLSTPIGFNRLRNYGTTPSNQSQANMFYPIQAQALSCLLHARNEPEQGAPVVIRRVKTFSNCKQYERS